MIRTDGEGHRGKCQGSITSNQKLPVTPTILKQFKGLWQLREEEPNDMIELRVVFVFLRSINQIMIPTLT